MFQIDLGNRTFAPGLLMTVLGVMVFFLFVRLGIWQLERADVKRQMAQRFEQQLAQDYQPLMLSGRVDPDMQYRKIKLRGQYLSHQTLLLDNQIHQGRAGYHVIQAFKPVGLQQLVLINRGWVAAHGDRNILPQLKPSPIADRVNGIVVIPSLEGYRLGETDVSQGWPLIIPFLDIEALQPAFDLPLSPYLVWMSDEVDDYYIRDWRPVWAPPEKSEAYALQWFMFAAIVLLLYIVLNLKRKEKPND